MRHYIERAMVAGLLLASLYQAYHEHWSPAGYLLFLSAFVDFEDWSQTK